MIKHPLPEAIIFDFDGTLIDSAPAILNAFAAALNEKDLTPHTPLNTSIIGPPLKETLIRLSGSDDAELIESLSDMLEPRLPGKPQLLAKQITEQSIRADRAIYVGDKQEDGLAANINKMKFHYASWGYGDLKPGQLDYNWTWLANPDQLCISAFIAENLGRGNNS
ncbi:HAD hydrolase-like protein, partial [bacterium]|nr:HAD hydrolase-like protein [bacterium]